ncbi:MAG: hypothetical protein LCI00_17045 [Chloroflexi bacterium]|nr:hypothetical protein [Chloroflexota bacterium]
MITCSKCGESQHNYHYFSYLNKFDKSFFVGGIPAQSDVCWHCAGPYRCLCCGEVKPPSAFRIMGRICNDCKIDTATREYTLKAGVKPRKPSLTTFKRKSAPKQGI